MKKSSSILCAAAAVSALAGCPNDPMTGTDAGPVGMTDTGIPSGADANVDARGMMMGNDTGMMMTTGGTCAMPIDLDTDGTALAMGTGRRITGSNTGAPAAHMSGLFVGDCADDGEGGSSAVREVVFRYTTQTAAHLVATTTDASTTADLDTVVYIADGCDASATQIACNDDVGGGVLTSRALGDAIVPAGTEVFIVVGGYGGADVESGTFGLVVSEIQPHAAGEACDAENYFCVENYTCIVNVGDPDNGTCLADGADRGLCRITMPYCDSGLGCTNDMPTADATGQCQVPIATGGVCSDSHYLCMPGASCQLDEGSEDMGHCLADGTEYGLCRITGMACDAGLTCSEAMPSEDAPGTCQMPIAGAGACTERHSVCVDGFSCQLDDNSEDMRHCIADGGDRGECRGTMPYCDGTLTCSADMPSADDAGVCLTPFAAGAVCTAWRFLCVEGSNCVADEGSSTMGHCLVDGTAGAFCRETAPECDGTLECDPFLGICNPPA